MTDVKISIIIPAYNRESIIGETLQSIQKQTYTDWECIVVDDGSTDTTSEVVTAFAKADSRIQLHKRPEQRLKGANACRNYGFEISNGKYVNWFDSDDLMLDKHLEEKMAIFHDDPTIDVCLCENQNFQDKEGDYVHGKVNTIKEENLLREFILRQQFIQTGCGLWKRSFLETHFEHESLFDEQLSQSQDYDFYARALSHEPKKHIIHDVLFSFRRGNASISTEFGSVNNVHHNSYILVRNKLIKKYKGDINIQVGLVNMLLHSYNIGISTKDKTMQSLYKSALVEAKKQLSFQKAFKLQSVLFMAKVIQKIGKGGHAMRRYFKI